MANSPTLFPLLPLLLLIAAAALLNLRSAYATTALPRILAAADAPAAAAGPTSSSSSPPATPATPKAPVAAPPADLVAIMSKKGCKSFASLLSSLPDVLSTFQSDISGGLTVFCPVDRAVSSFMPRYKNLTADSKSSLLLFHGVPVYYSLQQLRSSNGEMNTLATDGTTRNFNFTVLNAGDIVTIKTGVQTASVQSTVYNDGSSLAVFAVDEVLKPQDLFKPAQVPTPAPAPEEAPGKNKRKNKGPADAASPAADAPEGVAADQKAAADSNAAGRKPTGRSWTAAATASVALSVAASVLMTF